MEEVTINDGKLKDVFQLTFKKEKLEKLTYQLAQKSLVGFKEGQRFFISAPDLLLVLGVEANNRLLSQEECKLISETQHDELEEVFEEIYNPKPKSRWRMW